MADPAAPVPDPATDPTTAGAEQPTTVYRLPSATHGEMQAIFAAAIADVLHPIREPKQSKYRGPLDAIAPGLYPTALTRGGAVTDPDEIEAIRLRVEKADTSGTGRNAWRRVLRWIRGGAR